MTWVYRVEDSKGRGPYRSTREALWVDGGKFHWGRQWPVPRRDGIQLTESHVCGFATLKDLHAWFSPTELDRLKDLGYNVKKIRASDVRPGSKQLAFIPRRNIMATLSKNGNELARIKRTNGTEISIRDNGHMLTKKKGGHWKRLSKSRMDVVALFTEIRKYEAEEDIAVRLGTEHDKFFARIEMEGDTPVLAGERKSRALPMTVFGAVDLRKVV